MNADGAMNDTGIWNYVSTDQVRFINKTTNETIELANIPPLVFYSFGELSEVARSRKQMLTSLIPRLKIKDVATIKDKFLVVTGNFGHTKFISGARIF